MKKPFLLVPAFLAALAATSLVGIRSVQAESRVWTNSAGDGLVSTALNWDDGTVPVSGDAINFTAGQPAIWDLAGVVPSAVTLAGNLSLRSPLFISGNALIVNGSFKTESQALNVGGDLTMTNGSLQASGAPLNVSGNWTVTGGTVSLAATTVVLNGSKDKVITSGGQHFGGLTVDLTAGTADLADDLAVDNALKVSAGDLDVVDRTLTVQGGITVSGGELTIGRGKLVLAGTVGRPLAVSGGALSFGPASTVEYRPVSGSVIVESAVYGNLSLSNPGVYTLINDATVNNTMTVAAGAVFSPSGHVLSVPNGSLVNLGAIGDGVIRCPALSFQVLDANGAALTSIKNSSGTIVVRVEDRDLNRKGDLAEMVPQAITITTMSGDKETLGLTETAAASGIFTTAALIVHQGAPQEMNGQIETTQNDIIFVKYADPQDPTDAKSAQVSVALASASASGTPQIVSGPRTSNWNSLNLSSGATYSTHIVWDTDLLSTSAVTVTSSRLTTPITAGDLTGTTSHDVAITGLIRGYDYSFTVTSLTAKGQSVTSKLKKFTVIVPGDRIKAAASPAVYWYLNEKRQVFPDFTAYDSWFPDWKGVVTVSAEQLADLPLGKTVPIRAGTYLVKISSDPRTYAVEPNGQLRWIQTEAQAVALYGSKWSQRVRDVDVSLFVGYTLGDPLRNEEAPNGLIYQISGSELTAVIDKVAHPLSEMARKVNGLSARFVSAVAPATVAGLQSGSSISGYEPALDSVLKDGATSVSAPAFGF